MAPKQRVLSEDQLGELFVFMISITPLQQIDTDVKRAASLHFDLPLQLVRNWVRRWKVGARADPKFWISGQFSNRGRTGVKKKFTPEFITQHIKNLEASDRRSLDTIAAAVGCSKSTILRRCKNFSKKKVNNPTVLTETAQVNRVVHCLRAVQGKYIPTGPTDPSKYRLHIDEKPFYRQKSYEFLWLFDDEDKSKFSRPGPTTDTRCAKLQFVAAVGNPIPSFDGKLGIWAMAEEVSVVVAFLFVFQKHNHTQTHNTQTYCSHTFFCLLCIFLYKHIAKRTTKNQTKGDTIFKPIPCIDKSVYWKFLTQKIIREAAKKLPPGIKTLTLQHDNAPIHCSDEEFCMKWPLYKAEVLEDRDLEVRLTCQPASSPDTNVLDLGVFASCQSRQLKHYLANFTQLIELVNTAFEELEEKKLTKIWHTLASTANLIIKRKGDNDYLLPRSGLKKDTQVPSKVVASPACGEVTEWVIKKLKERLEVQTQKTNEKHTLFSTNKGQLQAWKKALEKQEKTEQDLQDMNNKLLELTGAELEMQEEWATAAEV